MQMDELLTAMDRTSANLTKLEDLWRRATSAHRTLSGLRPGVRRPPPSLAGPDGWPAAHRRLDYHRRVPDADALGQDLIDCLEIRAGFLFGLSEAV